MRHFNNASEFYTSQEWRRFRLGLMNERTAADGLLYCEHCGKPILKPSDCIAHHVREITRETLNVPEVTLNPENIQLLHAACHNEVHQRFGHELKGWQRKAYVVFTPPLGSGEAYVRAAKGRGDLVLDTDSLWRSLTAGEGLEKPKELNDIVFSVRKFIIDKIAMRAGTWQRAWVLSSEPYPSGREDLLKQVGGEPIYMDDTEEECLERLHQDPKGRDVNLYERLIRQWFKERKREEEKEGVKE